MIDWIIGLIDWIINVIDLIDYRIFIPIFFNHKMTWDKISSAHMEYGFFVKNMVVLTLKKQKRGKNLEQKIYVICSEHDAEYILEAIKRFMRSSKAA